MNLYQPIQNKIDKNYKNNKAKFDKIFLEETNNLPEESDSVYFFLMHGIDNKYVGKEIPYSEIARIAKQGKNNLIPILDWYYLMQKQLPLEVKGEVNKEAKSLESEL